MQKTAKNRDSEYFNLLKWYKVSLCTLRGNESFHDKLFYILKVV